MDIVPTETNILTFANAYGSLLLPRSAEESQSWWADRIQEMHLAVTLWDAIEADNIEIIQKHVEIQKGGGSIYYSADEIRENFDLVYTMNALAGEKLSVKAVSTPADLVPYVASGSLIHGGLLALQDLIDRNIKETVNLTLVYEIEHDRLSLQAVPRSLLAALWFQLARSVDEHRSYRRCLECGTWFEISDEASRTNRLFHSNACRSKAFRERQATAIRLFAEGASIEDIAQQLESDVATIQRWVTAPKRQRGKSK